MPIPRYLERLSVAGVVIAAWLLPQSVQAADVAKADGELRYSCGSDQPLVVRLAADRALLIVALPTGQVLELPALEAESGFAYGNDKDIFRGERDSATLLLHDRLPLECTALKPANTATASASPAADASELCLLERMRSMPPTATLAEVRQSCQPTTLAQASPTVFAEPEAGTGSQADETPTVASSSSRLAGEWAAYDNPYALTLNRPSYLMLGRQFSRPNAAPFREAFPGVDAGLDRNEAKFQISLKVPLALNLFDGRADVIAGYTNRSFWQVFNKEVSSPFRETNHEPEVWLRWRGDAPFLGGRFRVYNLGFNHQSNGQAGPLSRSWNRIFLETLYERGPVALNARVWQRLREDADKDDNRDIIDFMGRFELTGIYRHGESEFSAMLRRNLSTRKGAYQLDWSYPLYKNLRGYVQWFDGYGESLIDYNYRTRSLGIGVQLGGWLL